MSVLAVRSTADLARPDDDRFVAVLDRALASLSEASDLQMLNVVVSEVDAVRRAMAAFEVSDRMLKEARSVFVRSLEALGWALRMKYEYINPAVKGSGLKPAVVRAAMTIASPRVGHDRLIEAMADHKSSGLGAIQQHASLIGEPPRPFTPAPHVAATPFTPTVGGVSLLQDRVVDELRKVLALGEIDPASLRRLRGVRASAALLIDAIDYALAGHRMRALSTLRGDA